MKRPELTAEELTTLLLEFNGINAKTPPELNWNAIRKYDEENGYMAAWELIEKYQKYRIMNAPFVAHDLSLEELRVEYEQRSVDWQTPAVKKLAKKERKPDEKA